MAKIDISKYKPSPNLIKNQPLFAYIEVSIGGVVITDFGDDLSDTVMSFSVTRQADSSKAGSAGDKFNLQLYDDTALEIENLIYGTILKTSGVDKKGKGDVSGNVSNSKSGKDNLPANPNSSTDTQNPEDVIQNAVNNAKAASGKEFVPPQSADEAADSWNGEKSMWGNNGYTPATYVVDAYAKAGVNIMNGGRISEENLPEVLVTSNEFKQLQYAGEEHLQPGDILVKGNQVAIYQTRGKMLAAKQTEGNNGTVGSTDMEDGWTAVFRYTPSNTKKPDTKKDDKKDDKNNKNNKKTEASLSMHNFFRNAISANPFGDPDTDNTNTDNDKQTNTQDTDTKAKPEGTTTDKDESKSNEEKDKDKNDSESQDSNKTKDKNSTKNKKKANSPTNINNIDITYGWTNNKGKILTKKTIHGNFVKYSLEFENASTILSIEGTGLGTAALASPGNTKTQEFKASEYGGVPSKIVKKILKDEKIKYTDESIVETKPILGEDDKPKSFTRKGETAESFINKNLTEEATSLKTGEIGFRFFLDDKQVAHFEPAHSAEGTHSEATTEVVGGGEESNPTTGRPMAILGDGEAASTVYIGDSRTVGMSAVGGASGSNPINEKAGDRAFVGKVGEGLDYLRGEGWNNAKQYIGEGSNVVIWFGVNDINNIDAYCSYLPTLKQNVEAMGGRLTVCAVGPVIDDKSQYVKNSDIDSFNEQLNSACDKNGITFIDVNSPLKEMVNDGSPDGLHYTEPLYQKVLDMTSGSGNNGNANSGGNSSRKKGGTPPKTVEVVGFYEFYSGQNNSQVINFSPEWSDMAAMGSKNLASSVEAVDAMRNEIVKTMVKAGGYIQSEVFTGDKNRIMGKSSSSIEKLSNMALSMWQKNYARQNKATLEIMGDPELEPSKYIYIDVFTKYGFRHHTSGIYYVKSIEDSISDGKFTSTLQLQKHGPDDTNKNKGRGGSNGNSTRGGRAQRAANPKVEDFVQWMENAANDDSHGYSQNNRYGPDYDCSSSISTALQEAGFGNKQCLADQGMVDELHDLGWEWIPASDLGGMDTDAGLIRGDILMALESHVEVYCGDGKRCGAHSDRGHPQEGDQDGTEFSVCDYWNHPWDGIIRYKG